MEESSKNGAQQWFSENDVYDIYGKMLKEKELRRARQLRLIEYVPSGRDFFYKKAWVEEYLESKKVPKCAQTQNTLRAALPEEAEESGKSGAYSNSRSNGSSKKATGLTLVRGMTPNLAERVAEALAPQTSKRQKPN